MKNEQIEVADLIAQLVASTLRLIDNQTFASRDEYLARFKSVTTYAELLQLSDDAEAKVRQWTAEARAVLDPAPPMTKERRSR